MIINWTDMPIYMGKLSEITKFTHLSNLFWENLA